MAINPEDFHNNIREQLAHAGLPGVPEDVREVPLSDDAPAIEPGMVVPGTVAEGFSHGGLTTDEKFLAMTHSMEAPEDLDLPLSTEPPAEDDHITETDLFTEDAPAEPVQPVAQPETRESRLIMDQPTEPMLLPATAEHPAKSGKSRKWIAPTAGAAALLVAAGAYAGFRSNNEGSNADRAANTTPAATATQIPGATKNAPTPNTSVSPTDIPTAPAETATTPAVTAEKGSLESYQISVDKYPTVESAIPAFAKLVEEYMTTGVFSTSEMAETTESKEKGTVMLRAIFGDTLNLQDPLISGSENQGGWANEREALARYRLSIEGINGQGGMAGPGVKMEFHTDYQIVPGTTEQSGNDYTVGIVSTQTTNVSDFFPEHTSINGSAQKKFTLRQIDGANGKVWEIAWIANS